MQPTRRSYSKSFKAQVIQECAQPGASIASIALGHSLNANLVHKWIRMYAQKSIALQPAFIPLPMQLGEASSQATSVPVQVIDKGIPTAGLLAHVMIAKFADYLPLYRQELIFGRAGLAIPRSTLAQWVGMTGVQLQPLVDALRDVVLGQQVIHADETPVQMLTPGAKKTHRS